MIGETVFVDGKRVDNVLVEPGNHTDVADIDIPAGCVVAYTLRFPAAYDTSISDAVIEVRGIRCRSVGFADHMRPSSVFGDAWINPWDMTVVVERIEGELTSKIRLMEASTSIDDVGNPVRVNRMIWEGLAQARMETGSIEPDEVCEARSEEIWHFVIPWEDSFANLRPQSIYIDKDSVHFDVDYLKNIKGQSLYCDIKAVRHG